jgi:hypothetical protein
MVCVVLLFGENSMYGFPVLIFGLMSFYALIKNKIPAFFICSLYSLMFVFSNFVTPDILKDLKLNHNITSVLIMSVLLFLVLIPSFSISKLDLKKILRSNFLEIFLKASIIPIFFSFLYLLPFAIASVSSGAANVRTGLSNTGVLPPNIITTFAVGMSLFYPLFIMLFFYCRVLNLSKWYQFGMLVGSSLGVLGGLVFTARDRLIWVPLFFLLGYWIWGELISRKDQKKLLISGALMVSICIYTVAIFTVDRFSNTSEGIWGTTLIYFGAQPFVFAETIAEQTEPFGISLRFPVLAKILGSYEEITRVTPYEWMFGSFLSDFYAINGWFSLVTLCFAISAIFYFLFKSKKIDEVAKMLLILLYCQIVVQGIFYFSLGFEGGNYYLVMMVVMMVSSKFFGYAKKL